MSLFQVSEMHQNNESCLIVPRKNCESDSLLTCSASAKLAVIFPGLSCASITHHRLFLSWVLLLGFEKLLSLKTSTIAAFVMMCVALTRTVKICQGQSGLRQAFTCA